MFHITAPFSGYKVTEDGLQCLALNVYCIEVELKPGENKGEKNRGLENQYQFFFFQTCLMSQFLEPIPPTVG